jgi:hypothetical protein
MELRGLTVIALLSISALLAGCAQAPYQYGNFAVNSEMPQKVVVERGGSHKVIDRISDAISWPRRKLFPELPDRREISPETLEQVAEYLDKNELTDVHVSVRDYRPRDQWRRLRDSRVVPPLTRYTLGPLSVINYTLFPGKLFDVNGYNAYTNTLYVNADTPALLVHKAAFAKNVRNRKLPGAYVAAHGLPFVHAWPEIEAMHDVVGYAKAEQNWSLETETYEEIYPRVGSQAVVGAGVFLPVWWAIPAVSVAGGFAGGAAGKAALARRESERREVQAELVERDVLGRGVQQASFAEAGGSSDRQYVMPSVHQEPDKPQ